eukprot:scaffold15011_cov59-Attheya_sp.AAC.3
MQKDLHDNQGDPKKQGDIAAAWANETFGMTATYPGSTSSSNDPKSKNKNDLTIAYEKKGSKKRECRSGAGEEDAEGSGKTQDIVV